MASFNLFNDFAEQLAKGVHNFGTDTIKLFLSNSAPVATNAALSEITEIDYANISGAAAPTVAVAVSDATDTVLSSDQVVITATGAVPTFRYYGLYNDSAVSPADALICWWDHGSAVTLADGETFTIKFNNQASAGTIMTLGQGTIS
jgi:hypothetical protein